MSPTAQKVLLTGASGFVGSHTAEALVLAGHDVRCFVRSARKLRSAVGAELSLEIVEGDLNDKAAVRRAVEGVDAAVHVAGLVAARRPSELFTVNRDGTACLVDELARGGAERLLVLVSSLAAVGPVPRGRPASGDGDSEPVTPYGASKASGEEVVRASSLRWRILRPPAVYGPRDREFLRMFKAARSGLIPVFGDGSQELSLVHVADLAAAIVAVLQRGRDGASYFPAHPEITTARGIAHAVASALERKPRVLGIPRLAVRPLLTFTGGVAALLGRATLLSLDKAPEFLAEAWTCSPGELEQDTGWSARFDVASGMADTARWYREQGLL